MNKKKRDELVDLIKAAVYEAVIEAMSGEITMEKRRDEKTGLPLATPEIKTEKIFIPGFLVNHLNYHEGALRGMQETIDRESKNTAAFATQIESIGNILLGHEQNLIEFAKFVDHAKRHNLLGYVDEEEIEGEIIESSIE